MVDRNVNAEQEGDEQQGRNNRKGKDTRGEGKEGKEAKQRTIDRDTERP